MMIFTTKRTLTLILACLLGIFLVGTGCIISDKFIIGLFDPADSNTGQVRALNEGKNAAREEAVTTPLEGDMEKLQIAKPGDQENNIGSEDREDDFFANYRLERDRVRGQQVEMLNSVVADANSDAATRKEAQQKLMEIAENMDRELQLENLIKAKGYNEAAMFIQPGSATAILKKESLAEEDVNSVADIISRVTGYNLEDIVVIPK